MEKITLTKDGGVKFADNPEIIEALKADGWEEEKPKKKAKKEPKEEVEEVSENGDG